MAIKYYKLMDQLNRKGISKGQLKTIAGLSSATVAKLSTHKPVALDVIDKLCSALNCQPGDLIEYVADPDDQ